MLTTISQNTGKYFSDLVFILNILGKFCLKNSSHPGITDLFWVDISLEEGTAQVPHTNSFLNLWK